MEASNSLNAFFRHPTGYVCQITIRSENSLDLVKRFEGVLQWLQGIGAEPVGRPDAVVLNAAVLANAAVQANDGKGRPDWCPIHNVAMQKHTKGNQVWYSHKTDGGWCRGK